MKRNLSIAAIALLLLAGSSFTAARAAAPATMNVGTYNIWCGVHDDGPLPWKVRCQRIAALIRFHDYDIIGMQEVRPEQMADLRTALPEFTAVGTGREGINQGEHSPVFFRTDRFALLDSGTFWLSETPEKVSRGWDADYNRICSWVKLHAPRPHGPCGTPRGRRADLQADRLAGRRQISGILHRRLQCRTEGRAH